MRLGLPEPEHRAERVGHDGHAAGVHHVHGWHEHRAAGGGHLGHRAVGVVHIDVGHPHRGEVRVHLGTEAGHRLPVQGAHRIAAGLGRSLGAFPAKQAAVELLGLGQVRAAQVDP